MHDDLIDAVYWAVAQGIADPARIDRAPRKQDEQPIGAGLGPPIHCLRVGDDRIV
jgi:hypothetical protein